MLIVNRQQMRIFQGHIYISHKNDNYGHRQMGLWVGCLLYLHANSNMSMSNTPGAQGQHRSVRGRGPTQVTVCLPTLGLSTKQTNGTLIS